MIAGETHVAAIDDSGIASVSGSGERGGVFMVTAIMHIHELALW